MRIRSRRRRILGLGRPSSSVPRPVQAAPILAAAGIGATLAYLFDPDRGRSRRAQIADRVAGLMRRSARRADRGARYVRATGAGVVRRLSYRETAHESPNDATLAHKVESELFRDPTLPKGRMNINAENGVIVLRGVAESSDQIERIIASTLAIDGVREVRSKLRTPSEAPGPEHGELALTGAGTASQRRS